jgi:hypothetical protein
VSALSEWAEKVTDVAARIEASLAVDVARAQGEKFIDIEQMVTPKRSGALARSEHLDAVTGGGTHAVAVGGPHIIYAQFRNDGGDINAHYGEVWKTVGGKSRMYRHSLYFDGIFAMHVHQAGAHYVQKAEGAAAGVLGGIAEQVVAFYLDGL